MLQSKRVWAAVVAATALVTGSSATFADTILPGPTTATASSSFNGSYVVANLYDGNPTFNSAANLGAEYAALNYGSGGQDVNPVIEYDYGPAGVTAGALGFAGRSDPISSVKVWFSNTPFSPTPNSDPTGTLGAPQETFTIPTSTDQVFREYVFSTSYTARYATFQLINGQNPSTPNNPGSDELRLVSVPEPTMMSLVGLGATTTLISRRRRLSK